METLDLSCENIISDTQLALLPLWYYDHYCFNCFKGSEDEYKLINLSTSNVGVGPTQLLFIYQILFGMLLLYVVPLSNFLNLESCSLFSHL